MRAMLASSWTPGTGPAPATVARALSYPTLPPSTPQFAVYVSPKTIFELEMRRTHAPSASNVLCPRARFRVRCVSIGNRVATKLCMWQCERSARSAGGGRQWRRCAARGGVTLAAVALRLLLLLMLLLCCCCCTAFKRLRDLFMLPLHFGSNDPSSNPSGPRPHSCPAAMALCKLASCLNIKTMRPTERPMYS